jgi:hypothetical protein
MDAELAAECDGQLVDELDALIVQLTDYRDHVRAAQKKHRTAARPEQEGVL